MSRFLSRAGERIAELAEQSADEGRLSRGRALFRKGSVSELVITEGSVTASVRGSQGDRYETTISTALAPPGVRRQVADRGAGGRRVDELLDDGIDVCPGEIDLAFDCDCADWDEPCKHVVAVLLAFADRVDLDEAQLLHWRGLDSEQTADVEPGPGEPDVVAPPAATEPRPKRPGPAPGHEPPETEDRAARLSRLESLLGDTAMRVPAAENAGAGPAPAALEPALAAFLGVGRAIEPIELADVTEPAPLFPTLELGPLADLGPALAQALAIVAERLADPDPPDDATDR